MPTSVIAQANLDQAKRKYIKAKKAYYNSAPIMSDAAFDKLEDAIRKFDPDWKELSKTGVKVSNKKTEVDLLHPMPSLAKAYPEQIDKWLAKHNEPLYAMDKLDGSSLQVVYKNGVLSQIITRGDGERGGDISHLKASLNLPASISKPFNNGTVIFRCEAIMKKATFQKKWSREAKGKNGFDNPRNAVNGLLNRRDAHEALADVDVVVLGVIGQPMNIALRDASSVGLKTVKYTIPCDPDSDSLSDLLGLRRSKSLYEIDGLVLIGSDRKFQYKNSDRPKWTIAFKLNPSIEDAATAKVKRVIWQTSHAGRLTPKVEIEPIKLNGVVIKHATVHNAKWMEDRMIGPGAEIKIVRSGDVIPKIVDVVKKAKKLQLPEVDYVRQGVHFIAADISNEQRAREMVRFFKTLGIEFTALKTCHKMVEAFGTVEYVFRILLKKPVTFDSLCEKHGVFSGSVMRGKFVKEVHKALSKLTLIDLMVASNQFDSGVGHRRLTEVHKHIPLSKLMFMSEVAIIKKLTTVKGFGAATAKLIAVGSNNFRSWYDGDLFVIKSDVPKKKVVVNESGKLATMNVSWTGYRNSDQESIVQAEGGNVVPFGSKTDVLLYKDGGKKSSKIEKAGSKAMTWEQFTKKYGVK